MRLNPPTPAGAAFRSLAQVSVLAAASAALAACGGGDGSPAPAPVPAPAPAPALAPLAGSSSYLGTLSFGDTVALSLDSTTKQITLRFVDSRFGLAGAITSVYSVDANGQFVAQTFQAVAGSNLPGALVSRLSDVTLRFSAETGLVTGNVDGLPNLLDTSATSTASLQGVLTASNQGAAQISALAGTYNYLRNEAVYSASGKPGAPSASAGQLRIANDGVVRVCPGQGASDTCTNGITGRVTVDPDQSTYPGALVLELGGQRIGRAVVGKRSDGAAISVDVYSAAAGGSFTSGNWTLHSAAMAPVAATALDGEWLCTHPEQASTGRSMRHYVSIGNGLLQTDTIDIDLKLRANAASGTGVAANGLFGGQWAGGNGAARTLLPVSANSFYYAGSSGPADTDTSALGACQRLPEQAELPKYLDKSAASTDPVMITLADALPTQPAIGYDQIYYKQGRYTHTATGNVASSQWQKAFDDLCEDSGQDSTAKNGITASSKLNDRSSFTCKAQVANYQSLLKTAVVGPKGQLFLTDGHHSFTSLWEAPNSNGNVETGLAGGQVQMPVMIKGNYKDANNASFWRTMRANKFVWLKLPDGSSITPADLPRQLGLSNGLKDDPFRSLVYFTREVGYNKPVNPSEFLEFYWSEWLQASPRSFKLSQYKLSQAGNGSDGGYMQAIKDASNLMLAANPSEMIGASGYNAVQMGQMTAFGTATYADLSTPKPADGKKAGKLAYALEYRASLGSAK